MANAADFFDSRAENWEETCYPPPVRKRLEALIEAFHVKRGERLLDVGTGPGVLIPYLKSLSGSAGQVCALDFSFEMVCRARRKSTGPQDLIFRGDVHDIPFHSRVFDRVICFAAFPHFDNPKRAVQEMSRVLKPGGILIVAHLMSRAELAEHHGTHAAVAGDVLPDDAAFKSIFSDACLTVDDILNRTGRFIVRGEKRGGRNADGN